jgi:glycosyltransferase involved in cell wall biosynthesis
MISIETQKIDFFRGFIFIPYITLMNLVSIITITQKTRELSFQLLVEMIKNQTYVVENKIYEWIIVHDYDTIPIHVDDIPVVDSIEYVYYTKPAKIGELRNLANCNVSGDIMICMDDDDYYRPEYIEHCVERLSKSKCNIAGCSAMYMYQVSTNILFQYDIFDNNHTCNNCMAYKKEYIKYNMYDESCYHAEESSFTRHFTNNMIQLDPEKTVITICHDNNTFDKNNICHMALNGDISYLRVCEENIENVIPSDILHTMMQIY